MIFSNKTLEALTRHRPRTLDEALALPGIGPGKIQRYGKPFLEALEKWRGRTGGA